MLPMATNLGKLVVLKQVFFFLIQLEGGGHWVHTVCGPLYQQWGFIGFMISDVGLAINHVGVSEYMIWALLSSMGGHWVHTVCGPCLSTVGGGLGS